MQPALSRQFLTKLLCLVALAFLGCATGAVAQQIQGTISAQGRFQVSFQGDLSSYFILRKGLSVVNINTAVAMQLGAAGSNVVTDLTPISGSSAAYYRIQRVPVVQPLDTDGDGIDDVYELQHSPALNPLDPGDASAEAPGTGLSYLEIYRFATSPPRAVAFDPTDGSADVGVTVRPKVIFPQPIIPTSLNATNFYATSAGTHLEGTIVPANNGTFAWLFLKQPMPNASEVQVAVDGSSIKTVAGEPLDADGDGQPGGVATTRFTTVSIASVPGTVLAGRIVDPGPDLQPRTLDDIHLGPNRSITFLHPIAGVRVYLHGLEANVAVTDSNGWFELDSMPVGDVKVVVEGPAATTGHPGFYWPEMVIDSQTKPGITNFVSMIGQDPEALPAFLQTIYLPRIASNVLQTVTADKATTVQLQTNAAYNLPPDQSTNLSLRVQPNSLVGMDGQSLSSAQVGVSVVPPELVADMLPPGLLQHTFDITVQAPGVATFSTPAPMTFPNVFGTNALPGTKLNFLSFDHTTGRLVIDGTATVSADGLTVTTDPGTGVTHPGWHRLAPPGFLAQFVTWLGNQCPSGCDCAGAAKDGSKVLLAISLAAGAAAGAAPVLLFAGAVVGVGATVYDLAQKEDFSKTAENISDASGVIGGTLDSTGNLLATPGKIGQSKPFYLVFGGSNGARQALGSDWLQKLTKIGNKAKAAGETSFAKFFALFGVALDSFNLGSKLSDCFHQNQALRFSGQDSIGPIDQYLNALVDSTTNITDALEVLIGTRLFQSLPTDRSVLIGFDGTGVRANELDGSPYIDPKTGQAFTVGIGELIDERLFTDPNFRFAALSKLKSGLDQFGAKLSQNDAQFVAYVDELATLYSSVQQLYSNVGRRMPSSPLFYIARDTLTGAVVAQGRTTQTGDISFFGSPESLLTVEVFDPATAAYAMITTFTPSSGGVLGGSLEVPVAAAPPVASRISGASTATVGTSTTTLSLSSVPSALGLVAFPDTSSLDSDGDGLSDEAEAVIGSDPFKWSTCGDGISDGQRVAEGLDFSHCGVLPTGVIASLGLPGVAKEVVLTSAASGSAKQTAYVALGSSGLAVVDASQYQRPLLLGQLSLPGDAVDVSVDETLGMAIVAGTSTLHFVDVSNPAQPQLLRSVPVAAQKIQVVRGIAYAGVGSKIQSYELITGRRLQSLDLKGASVTGLSSEGVYLYSMDASHLLRTVDISEPSFAVVHGSLNVPDGGGKLFVGNGVAYISGIGNFYGGFATVNVSDPDNPVLVAGSSAVANSASLNPVVAVNGSGLALVLSSGGRGAIASVQVFDVSNPANTGSFLTLFSLPSDPYGVAIGGGIAFIADGTAGLQVVNYQSLDTKGIPPTIQLVPDFQLLTPTNGVVAEGTTVSLTARVSDDVQVRDVEFYVDGAKVADDISFPFEFKFVSPLRSDSKTNFTVRAKATDTGGNSTWTVEIAVALVRDTTPPRVIQTIPGAGDILGGTEVLTAYFNKPVANFNEADFIVKSAGPDRVLGTPDDVLITGGAVTYRADVQGLFLNFSNILPGGLYQAELLPPLSDLAGDLIQPYSWTFGVNGGVDSDQDGIPDAIEILMGLDPNNPDSDGSGVLDGDKDPDGDGLPTRWELLYGYDPLKADTDGNGVRDGDEDPDFDGLTNLQEYHYGTNPLLADTDGDGWDDATEIATGTDPLDPRAGPAIIVSSPAIAYLNGATTPEPAPIPTLIGSAEVSFLNAVLEAPPSSVPSLLFSSQASYLNALRQEPPANAPLTLFSLSVSYLNARTDPPPDTVAQTIFSAQTSFLNALRQEPPANVPLTLFSLSVSYLNSRTDPPPDNVPRTLFSDQTSYLNASQEPGPLTLQLVSPLVSYFNEPENPNDSP